jgi:hypothetical protein
MTGSKLAHGVHRVNSCAQVSSAAPLAGDLQAPGCSVAMCGVQKLLGCFIMRTLAATDAHDLVMKSCRNNLTSIVETE